MKWNVCSKCGTPLVVNGKGVAMHPMWDRNHEQIACPHAGQGFNPDQREAWNTAHPETPALPPALEDDPIPEPELPPGPVIE